jgi:hypothetical protein
MRIPPRDVAVLTQDGLRVTGEEGCSATHKKTKAIKEVRPRDGGPFGTVEYHAVGPSHIPP